MPTHYEIKKAFTITELVIVVAILGIIVAIALPVFQEHIQKAKETTAKDNLRIFKIAIERYAAQHNGVPPGYPNNDPSKDPTNGHFYQHLVNPERYLPEKPKNPFNNKFTVRMVKNGEEFPAVPVGFGTCGWIYKASTKTIKLNWPGSGSDGVAYFDY